MTPSRSRPIVIVQPQIAHYRIDFYRRLAARLADPLLVVHGTGSSLPDADLGPDIATRAIAWSRLRWPTRQPSLRAVVALVARRRPRVLVMSANTNYLAAHLIVLLCRLRHIRTIGWGQLKRARCRRWFLPLKLAWMRAFDHTVFYTSRERREACARGFPRHRCTAIDNGLARRPLQSADLDLVRQNGPFVFCARLLAKNRADLLIAAYTRYRARGGRRPLAIIGDGPLGADLRARVAQAGLGDAVCFRGALYDSDIIDRAMATAYAMVHPYAIGLSIVTAFLQGCPLIACRDPWQHMPEFWLWHEGLTGWGFDAGSDDAADAEVLAMALREADTCTPERYRIIRRCCRRAAERVDTAVMAERMAQAIARVAP